VDRSSRREKQRMTAVLVACLLLGCGEGEGAICYSPEGFPGSVGRPPPVAPGFDSFSGCEPAETSQPQPGQGSVCGEACKAVSGCENVDATGCLELCRENPQCAEGFRCLRDTPCEELILCAELLFDCQ
jgi:hypothetical protein